MPKGISLHVGINELSSAFPGAGPLTGPENDAREMEKIAVAKGFFPHDLLLGCEATYARVTTKIRTAACNLEAGDIFLFTFAGHGFQKPNQGFDPDDPDTTQDGRDETIVLFDVELIDDVLRKDLWPCFRSGVRILMIADCCHSGDIFLIPEDVTNVNPPPAEGDDEFPVATSTQRAVRAISTATGRQHMEEYGEFYRNALRTVQDGPINATLMLLAACESFDVTLDADPAHGEPNGMYTASMLEVLKNSDPPDYVKLVKEIQDELKKHGRPTQKPLIQPAPGKPDFRTERPFKI
jgi:caspase domain-containing protein